MRLARKGPVSTPAPALDQEDLSWRLQRTFASPTYKPPLLPAAALEIMQLAQRPDVSFEKLAPALEHDPVLTARVVAVAQSAAYSARSPILTLHQAAVRLGVKGIRDLVMEAALHLKVFRAPGQDAAMARLARHSGAVAHVVRAVCRHTRLEAEHAFLCGLLHDVGFAACALVLAEDPELRRTPFAEVAQVIDQIHVEASALLTKAWGLPLPIQRLVGTHHDVLVNDKVEPLNAALIVAEQLVWGRPRRTRTPWRRACPSRRWTGSTPTGPRWWSRQGRRCAWSAWPSAPCARRPSSWWPGWPARRRVRAPTPALSQSRSVAWSPPRAARLAPPGQAVRRTQARQLAGSGRAGHRPLMPRWQSAKS
jgi:HD-like signal output (HDOD) protein